VRVPQVLEADFLLLGAQIYLYRGLYLRPALGMGWQANAYYRDSAYVSKELGPAVGASMGYHLKVHQRFSLGIEGSLLLSETESDKRTVFGIQMTPLLDF
jgi:hypothetical protein